jgi:ABC-type multidrug transport system fused ATPase/permease subunit
MRYLTKGKIVFKYVLSTLFLLSPRDRTFVISFGLIRILLVGFDMLGIILVGILITRSANSLNSRSQPEGSFSYLQVTEDLSIKQISVLVLVSFLSKSIFSVVFMRLMANTLAKAEGEIAKRFFGKILSSPFSKLNDFSHAEIVNSVTYAINFATTQLITIFVIIISEVAMLIAILTLFASINFGLTLMMGLYFLMIGLAIQKVLGSKLQSAGKIYSKSISAATTTVTDAIGAFREISTMSKQDVFVEKFSDSRYQYAKAMSLVNYYSALPRYIVESALMVGVVGLTFFSFNDSTSPAAAGTLGVFLVGGLRIVASMLPLQNSLGGLKQLIGQAASFYEINRRVDFTPDQNQLNQISNLDRHKSEMIKFKEVYFKYPGSENFAVKNLTFQINPGELIAIIGSSGSGKSTLADLIVGLTYPTTGAIERGTITSSKAGYSYVPQSPGIISGTICENITLTFDATKVNFKLLQKSIKLAHLSELIDSLPNGVDTDLGAQSNALSGGQMQRIGLARALYGDPRLLMLDEATSALDAETESAISENLDELRGKCTTVVIAHRLATVQGADRVFVMDGGEIVSIGKFSDLAKSNSIVARYIELSELKTS